MNMSCQTESDEVWIADCRRNIKQQRAQEALCSWSPESSALKIDRNLVYVNQSRIVIIYSHTYWLETAEFLWRSFYGGSDFLRRGERAPSPLQDLAGLRGSKTEAAVS